VLVAQSLAAARAESLATITVTGGVACNARLRERMRAAASERGLRAVFPSPGYCTDNAAMIAGQGWHLFRAGRLAGFELDAVAR
jgi:N6-L-threonylcarbamoyladenine synthase